jgi:hypothetical protein
MRRLIAAVAVTTLLIGTVAPAAHAGGPNDAARALASFAAFHQAMFSVFVAPLLFPPPVVVVRPEVVYRPVVAPPPAVVYAAPAPRAYPAVVPYPHGRYETRFRGHRYVRVWVPAVPPPPPPFAR